MAVYMLNNIRIKLPNGVRPCSLSADTAKELDDFAAKLGLTEEQLCVTDKYRFYSISATMGKKAVNMGALTGEEAERRLTMISKMRRNNIPVNLEHP